MIGCMHGFGTFKAADTSVYTGGWVRDLKHGLGKKEYANGDKYDGIWKNGKPDGPGRYVWADGNVYNGEWQNGRMHGQGTFQWKTGERYDGEWKVYLLSIPYLRQKNEQRMIIQGSIQCMGQTLYLPHHDNNK